MDFELKKKYQGEMYLGFLTLTREKSYNALNQGLVKDLTVLFQGLSKDSGLRCLIIQGRGKIFCSGADLKEMQKSIDWDEEKNHAHASSLRDMFEALRGISSPVVSYVQGGCYGGALGFLSCCDLVYSHPQTKFSFSEVRLGIIPAIIFPYCYSKFSKSLFKSLALSGDVFSAKVAKDLGLAYQLVEDQDEFMKILHKFLNGGPLAQVEIKKIFNDFECGRDFDGAKTLSKIRVSKEAQQGLNSFFDKKQPSWVWKDDLDGR